MNEILLGILSGIFLVLLGIFSVSISIYFKLVELCGIESVAYEIREKFKKNVIDEEFIDPYQNAWDGDPAPESKRIKTI